MRWWSPCRSWTVYFTSCCATAEQKRGCQHVAMFTLLRGSVNIWCLSLANGPLIIRLIRYGNMTLESIFLGGKCIQSMAPSFSFYTSAYLRPIHYILLLWLQPVTPTKISHYLLIINTIWDCATVLKGTCCSLLANEVAKIWVWITDDNTVRRDIR